MYGCMIKPIIPYRGIPGLLEIEFHDGLPSATHGQIKRKGKGIQPTNMRYIGAWYVNGFAAHIQQRRR
jgi:hypothetical protein